MKINNTALIVVLFLLPTLGCAPHNHFNISYGEQSPLVTSAIENHHKNGEEFDREFHETSYSQNSSNPTRKKELTIALLLALTGMFVIGAVTIDGID